MQGGLRQKGLWLKGFLFGAAAFLTVPGLAAAAQEVVEEEAGQELAQAQLYAAGDTTWQEDYDYTITENEIHLSEYKGNGGDLIIPKTATIEGTVYSVVLNGLYFFREDNITSFKVESGVKAERIVFGLPTQKPREQLRTVDIKGLDTSRMTNMSRMFFDCINLTALDVSTFDTSKVTDMDSMFYDCNSLKELDVSNFDTSKVIDMGYMFYGCSGLSNLDISKFDTSKVVDMGYMFYGCKGLGSLDISGFNTSITENMEHMFFMCSNLTDLDLSAFDTSRVQNMGYMFSYCTKLTALNLSGFNTGNVTYMNRMFSDCENLKNLDLSSFDIFNVKLEEQRAFSRIFYNCSGLSHIKTPVNNMDEIFLPAKMYDKSGVEYEKIPAGLTESITLKADWSAPDPDVNANADAGAVSDRNLVWVEESGKSYWYENNERQGVYGSAGNVWYDGTERGREIYDPASDAWYWLDASYDGAKAVNKEVFMPYIYQDEEGRLTDEAWLDEVAGLSNRTEPQRVDLSAQIRTAVQSHGGDGAGKWVRYDAEGRMIKGWYTVQGSDVELYPSQAGNTYYYDQQTGLMAKGDVTIDGVQYHFDEVTGVRQ